MNKPLKEVTKETTQTTTFTSTIPVKYAFLHSAIYLVGATEMTLNPQRMPGIELAWTWDKGEGLIVKYRSETYFVPAANVKSFSY